MSEAAKSSGLTPGVGIRTTTREPQARFVQENLRRIFLQIYRIVGNVDDAQDLTQETFIKALQRQDQIKDLEKAAIGFRASPATRRSISCAGTAGFRFPTSTTLPSRSRPSPTTAPNACCFAPSRPSIWKTDCGC